MSVSSVCFRPNLNSNSNPSVVGHFVTLRPDGSCLSSKKHWYSNTKSMTMGRAAECDLWICLPNVSSRQATPLTATLPPVTFLSPTKVSVLYNMIGSDGRGPFRRYTTWRYSSLHYLKESEDRTRMAEVGSSIRACLDPDRYPRSQSGSDRDSQNPILTG